MMIVAMIVSPVSPFFVGLMLVMVMPFIPFFLAFTDESLSMGVTAEVIVLPPVLVIMEIGLRLIHHDLPAMVQVEMRIGGRKSAGKGPVPPAVEIDEFMRGDIVITLDVGDIIIFHVIIPRRTPGRLIADVDGKMDLGLRGV
jgi:hypothetical protein